MKKQLQFFLCFMNIFILTGISVYGQTLLTATGMDPVPGDGYAHCNAMWVVSPGSPGAGQTWNLSGMTMPGIYSGTLQIYSSAASTDSAAVYPNATVAFAEPLVYGPVYYYNTSPAALQYYGYFATGRITYTDPEDILRFPAALNDTYTDTWSGQSWYSFQHYQIGTTTITVDGYGTLITPFATFSNAVRVHSVQTYRDSTYTGTPYVTSHTLDSYIWYKQGIHTSLARIDDATYANYLTGYVGVEDPSSLSGISDVYPNPCVDAAKINITLPQNKKIVVRLFNTLGQQMLPDQTIEGSCGSNVAKINAAMLPEGVYSAQIILDNNIAATKRFVITK